MKRFVWSSLVAAMSAVFFCSLPVSADIRLVQEQAHRDIILQAVKAPGNLTDEVKLDEMYRHDFDISFSTNKAADGDVYTFDENIEFKFTSKKDCYLTVLDFTPDGKLVVLFPNQWAKDNFVKADQEIQIPPVDAKFELKSGGPVGTDRVVAIATSKPVPVVDLENNKLTDAFAVIDDRAPVTRQIILAAKGDNDAPDAAPTDQPVATPIGDNAQNETGDQGQAIKPNMAIAPNEKKDEQAEWAVAHIAVHNRSKEDAGSFVTAKKGDWLVKCWTDRPNFKASEKFIIRFQTNRPCKLLELADIGIEGNVNSLLPVGQTIDLKENIINVLPGKEHKFIYEATAPAGTESIVAKLADNNGKTIDLNLSVQTIKD